MNIPFLGWYWWAYRWSFGTCGGNKWRFALVVRWASWRSEPGLWVHFEIGRRLNDEENIFPGVFSILNYHVWITHDAFHSSIAAEALAGRLAAQREPIVRVSASFAVERSQSWNIWHDVGQVSLRWVKLSWTRVNFVPMRKVSSGIMFISVYDSFLWKWLFNFLNLFGSDLHSADSFR